MPSSTDTGPHAWLEAARDTRHLIAFRARTVRRRGAAFLGLAVVLVLTVGLRRRRPRGLDCGRRLGASLERALAALESNLGAAFAGFLLLAVGAAMGSGGGRELLSRSEAADPPDQPASPSTSARSLLAPVNLAWLVQAWGLLAVTALVTPPGHLARRPAGRRWPGSSPPPRSGRPPAGPWRAYDAPPAACSSSASAQARSSSSSPRSHLAGLLAPLVEVAPHHVARGDLADRALAAGPLGAARC